MSVRADSLLDGSWNGLPFKYQDASFSYGRRGQMHEYADRDDPYFEDLGRRARQYTLDIFLVGDDWVQQRLYLASEFEKGKGTLVHPTEGRMQATCLSVELRETVTELGRVDLSVTILPDSLPLAPPLRDSGSDVDSASAAATSASQSDFNGSFAYSNQPFEVRTASESAIDDAIGAIGGVVGFAANVISGVASAAGSVIGGAIGWFNYGVSAVGAVARTVLRDAATVSSIVNAFDNSAVGVSIDLATASPATTQAAVTWVADLGSTRAAISLLGSFPGLGVQLGALVTGISTIRATGSGAPFTGWAAQRRVGTARNVMRAASRTNASAGYALVTTGGYSKPTIAAILQQHLALADAAARPILTPGAEPQTVINSNAVHDIVRRTALVEAAGAFSAMPFDSRAEAFTLRDQLADAIDAECNLAESAPARIALQTLRIAIVNDARTRSQALPDVVALTLPREIPAVVLAARLYDDPGMAADLVARNGVDNALFMPAGVALEVLTNG
jgi:prophage DNA circulation protein